MCGIAGSLAGSQQPIQRLHAALVSMRHRGPDAQGVWSSPGGRTVVALGHVRLSILDLSDAANQPFHSSDGRWTIVFNGEIYNHASLRKDLQSTGWSFRTHSDTEVLLASYVEWGSKCLRRLDGMFSFAIHDKNNGSLFAARDPVGIKPFYYHWDSKEGCFSFASEIRALAALTETHLTPDPSAFAEYLLNGFLYEPRTGFVGISKLPPGSYLHVIDASQQAEAVTYDDGLPTETPAKGMEALVTESVSLQCFADVPVGLAFSGGIDSSVLAAFAKDRIRAIFVDFGLQDVAKRTESLYARRIATSLGFDLTEIHHSLRHIDPAHILNEFRRTAAGNEEPISDYTFIASELIAGKAREVGLKVLLSGMGGDELFAGYPRHRLVQYGSWARAARWGVRAAAPLLRAVPRFAKRADRLLGYLDEKHPLLAYTLLVGYFSPDETVRMLGASDGIDRFVQSLDVFASRVSHECPMRQAMYLDRFGYLSHNLTVTDRSSMLQSVEVRVPLITPGISNWAAFAPADSMVDLKEGKKPLRELLRQHVSPQLVNRPKVGFNPPLDDKIASVGSARLLDELTTGPIQCVADLKPVRKWVEEHFSGRRNHAYRLWQLLHFNYWLEAAKVNMALPSVGTAT